MRCLVMLAGIEGQSLLPDGDFPTRTHFFRRTESKSRFLTVLRPSAKSIRLSWSNDTSMLFEVSHTKVKKDIDIIRYLRCDPFNVLLSNDQGHKRPPARLF